MDRKEIRAAIRDFLSLLESDELSVERTEDRLPAFLDRLALAQSYVSFTFDETDYPDSPDQSYDDLRALVSKRFPNYGYYNVAEPITTNIGEAGTVVGFIRVFQQYSPNSGPSGTIELNYRFVPKGDIRIIVENGPKRDKGSDS